MSWGEYVAVVVSLLILLVCRLTGVYVLGRPAVPPPRRPRLDELDMLPDDDPSATEGNGLDSS